MRIGETFAVERETVCTLLNEFGTMWDGSLGEIYAAELRIERKPDSKPVHQPPYRDVPATRVVTRREIAEMREDGFVELANTE